MQFVKFVMECESCGEEMSNLVGVLESDGDVPVLDIGLVVSQEQWNCGNCGGATYTGDFEDICFHEPGELGEDEEEDD